MSISTRIEAIEQHLTDDYSVLEVAGANLTNVDKNIINLKPTWQERLLYFINNGTDVVWNNWEKVEGTGETLTLNSTEEAPMKINLKGNTSQETTTGKNLLPTSDIISASGTVSNGITFTLNSDGSIKANGTATGAISIYINADYTELSAGTYTFSDSVSSGESGTTYFLYADVKHTDGSSWDTYNFSLANATTGMTQTIPEAFKFKTRIVVRNGQTLNNVVFKPMLEVGSSASSYEPYTNGASPNPDYPQDIHVVSGDNTINVCGKNLFDGNWIAGTVNLNTGEFTSTERNRSDFIQVSSNTQYTIWTGGGVTTYFIEYGKNHNFIISNTIRAVETQKTFTTNENTKYVVLYQYTQYSPTNKVQLEVGNQATEWEAYKGASYPISLGDIELCKIGTYQDRIAKSTGKNLCNTTFELGGIDTTTGQNGSGTDRIRSKDYVEVKANTTYTLSGVQGSRVVCFYNSSKAYLSYEVIGSQSTSGTFITPNDTSYIRWYIIQTNTNINEMLNEGTTALPYEPYGKVWYLNKQTGKVVLNGSEAGWNEYTQDGVINCYNNSLITFTNQNGFSNYFTLSTDTSYSNTKTRLVLFRTLSGFGIYAKTNIFSSLANFKTWLSTHNTIAYFVLATPTYTEITDSTLLSQLDTIKRSYDEQTNITQVNNDLPFILDVTALKQLN